LPSGQPSDIFKDNLSIHERGKHWQKYDRKPLIIGILFANEEKSCTFAPTVSATLPVEQRTMAELLPLYYDIFGNNSEPQGNLFFHP